MQPACEQTCPPGAPGLNGTAVITFIIVSSGIFKSLSCHCRDLRDLKATPENEVCQDLLALPDRAVIPARKAIRSLIMHVLFGRSLNICLNRALEVFREKLDSVDSRASLELQARAVSQVPLVLVVTL